MKPTEARILLTGAYGGIGEAAAAAFFGAGAALMLSGRSPAKLAAQSRMLMGRTTGDRPRVEWRSADLTSTADLASLASDAREWQCNVIVHAAGLASFGHLETATPESMARVLQTNLLAPMLLTRALLPHLRGLPRAQVICVGSALGGIGLPGYSIYSASKFGLRGFAQALRRELADSAVLVQYLGPRTTRTGFNSREVEAYNRATGSATDDPAIVARSMLRMLEDEAPERFLGYPEKLAVRINGVAPALLDGAFAKHRRSLPALPRETSGEAGDTTTRTDSFPVNP
ncbi:MULTISPECIES: SDR family oxidoreductase [unclassified Variovorax]|uniref:SDR family oxidoreductase n=1 Tax=unclassified Variovorax TaxID=663243 RepID=UPI00076D39EE|nr:MULTISPECIES: SDR family oxidoreductase [unclassified Variovorax]KWT96825.1 3-oxoacyl-[acyl-carrier protein] reductase [Variovorax sp. WDL1]PNG47192.1 putative oxidoreductase SadH [Variovorax sp. B2]PNG48157.1 putative oxidoreductase SadH [Variovorax sp. B4]VTV15072.1 Putative oxidoreductase SadH [Variovorax sp. WDL1]